MRFWEVILRYNGRLPESDGSRPPTERRLRIVSWNCYRGECRARASRLDSLQPDLVVLQECGRPASTDTQCLWFGTKPIQGVGLVANDPWHLQAGPLVAEVPDSAYPVELLGPAKIHLLAIWAKPRPTYDRAILDALDHYREFLLSAPSLVIGDFNSHPRWNASDPSANHSVLADRLREEFGLAFHEFGARSGRTDEPATLFWQWKEKQPFHIDYCFIPELWSPHIQSVEVGGYQQWADQSDHRPLAVELAV